MGRNYQQQRNYTENRGSGNQGHDGYNNDRRYNNQHDDREGGHGGGGGPRGGVGNRVWVRGGGSGGSGVHNRLGTRQVNFVDDGPRRGGISKRGQRGKYINKNIHIVLPEEDEEMGGERRGEQAGTARPRGFSSRGPRGPRGPGGGRVRYSGQGRPSGIMAGSGSDVFSWHKVILRNGTKYDKIVLLKELLAKSNIKFIPICYSKQGINTFFYLEDQAAARTLRELDKKIEMPDGFPLSITVDRSTPPNMPLTDDLVEKIKVVMSKRYFPENKALDLKAFHLDESFAGESFYAPLWRSNVMNKVLTIIMDNIPEVTAIDLSNNKLNSMSIEAFSSFKTKVKELRILYLADNKIQDTRGLERMRGIELAELKLTGNPVIEKIGSTYKEAVRKIFPKLVKLDDKELPKEIGFDAGDDDDSARSGELPPNIQKMIKSPEFEPTAMRFLEEFFKLYDSDSRQPLLEAYHEEAVMSLSAVGNTALLPAYIPESRNLRRVDYEKKRHDLLRRGKLQIVAFLSKLPKTEHDTTTFTIDMPFASATLMTFTVTGLFRERDTKLKESIRHFNRCFIGVPHGGGFCIINETLYISTATDLSTRKAFVSPPPAAAPVPVAPALDPAAKQAMALSFAEKSGMNTEWSVRCLEEKSWNFDAAAVAFAEAKAAGRIPAEAFGK